MADTPATTQGMIATLVLIYRIASRALSDEERVGQRIQGDPGSEIKGLLLQLMTIEKLAHAGLPEEGLALLEIALAKEETARSAPRGGRLTDFISRARRSGRSKRSS